MYRSAESAKMFRGKQFQERQEFTLEKRQAVRNVLGLKPEHVEWYEFPAKKSTADFPAVSELYDIENLVVVNPITRPDETTPTEVLDSAHGTIIYRNKFILRQSTPYRSELEMNDLVPVDGKLSFNLPTGQVITTNVSDVSCREYEEGTIFDIMMINGKMQWFTLRNLIPKGVAAPTTSKGELCDVKKGKWLHQPSKWAEHHVAFAETFRKIIRLSKEEGGDPNFLEAHKLFPVGCKFSPVKYRFVIVTRERARANHREIGPLGYLVYLGHNYEWSKEEWVTAGFDEEEMGTWHSEEYIYKPYFPSQPPEDLSKAYVIQQEENVGLEVARKILKGNVYEKDVIVDRRSAEKDQLRFGCGGKLIATVRYMIGKTVQQKTFHIASTGWNFREKIMSNDADLYNHFTGIMNMQNFDPNNEEFMEYFQEQFSILKLPLAQMEKGLLKQAILEKVPLELISGDLDYLKSVTQHVPKMIWYNFLCCSNISIREKVYRYYSRYITELSEAATWLVNLKAEKVAWDENKPKDRTDVDRFRRLARTMKSYKVAPEDVLFHLLQTTGTLGIRVVKLAIKYRGIKKNMIKISEPEAVFFENKTYATICRG